MNIKRKELTKCDQLNINSQITFAKSSKKTKYLNNKNQQKQRTVNISKYFPLYLSQIHEKKAKYDYKKRYQQDLWSVACFQYVPQTA